jgi:tight adherence protein B
MTGLALAAAALVGLAVLLVFLGIGRTLTRGTSTKDRLEILAPAETSEEALYAAPQGKRPGVLTRGLSRVVSGRSFAEALATDLARANLPLTVAEYLLLRLTCAVVAALLVLVMLPQPLLAIGAGILGFFLPEFEVRRRQGKRQVAFQQQLPDVLTLMVGSLRSGYGMTIAMDTVSKQMPAPASEEFGRVVREIGLGLTAPQALSNLVRRIRSDDLDLVVTAITIQYEVGGNLATILETITATIRERVRLKAQLRTLTIQHRMTRAILTALPFLLGIVLYFLNPTYMLALFTPGVTLIIPIAALIGMTLGYLVMGKLSRIDV